MLNAGLAGLLVALVMASAASAQNANCDTWLRQVVTGGEVLTRVNAQLERLPGSDPRNGQERARLARTGLQSVERDIAAFEKLQENRCQVSSGRTQDFRPMIDASRQLRQGFAAIIAEARQAPRPTSSRASGEAGGSPGDPFVGSYWINNGARNKPKMSIRRSGSDTYVASIEVPGDGCMAGVNNARGRVVNGRLQLSRTEYGSTCNLTVERRQGELVVDEASDGCSSFRGMRCYIGGTFTPRPGASDAAAGTGERARPTAAAQSGSKFNLDRTNGGALCTMTAPIQVRSGPSDSSRVIDDYDPGAIMAYIGEVSGTGYVYVSPCRACTSGYVPKNEFFAKSRGCTR